jgi:tetratricopeptide (TPR) repeat protein
MGEGAGQGDGARYAAFISYSHRDAAFGRRLHRRLERYWIPRRLVGRETALGPVPRRLAPIFRDRDELAAAHDLTREVREALQASRALVVVCSPAAAASPWVAKEVRLFRRLHPDRPILAALIAGEPAEAFPEPLRRGRREPIAADFRKGGDGAGLARLKLVAGWTGLGLDELVQRDAQRQRTGVIAITAGALAAVLAMGTLTTFAITARLEAERERRQAEGLVEFMLTDLRDKLKGVGRLDVMADVNRKALDYYGRQDIDRLPVASLERRARVLHAMGEDALTRGQPDRALAQFAEARRTTAALMAQAPNDPERIFNQAQSEYWVAYVDYSRGRAAEAKAGWETYRRLAERMVALAPDEPKYLRELGYAEGALCAAALDAPKDPQAAVNHCAAALAAAQKAAQAMPGDVHVATDLVNRQAWLADAYMADGKIEEALQHRRAEERLLGPLMAADPKNMQLKQAWFVLQRMVGVLEYKAGRRDEVRAAFLRAKATIDEMVAFEPENRTWKNLQDEIDSNLNYLDKTSAYRGK